MFLKSRSFLGGSIPDNSYQAGVALAVEALGFSNDDTSGVLVKECIETATRIVRAPILRSAELANELASVLPARLEIQWYKDRCDASEEHAARLLRFLQTIFVEERLQSEHKSHKTS